ncbi:hypothetical protein C0992_001354 [Termitomyces sp. T32_za158]|nr:hypothetical protein C0992_001354 [Termitomyces sp. T32_za158]
MLLSLLSQMVISKITCILECFKAQNLTISEFLIHILSDGSLIQDTLVQDLSQNALTLLSVLMKHLQRIKSNVNSDSLFGLLKSQLQSDVQNLIFYGDDWQFGASSAQAQQLEEFQLDQMADKMAAISPHLWDLLETLLSATQKPSHSSTDFTSSNQEEEEYWEKADEIRLEEIIELISGDVPAQQQRLAAHQTECV